MALTPGTRLGVYDITAAIGEGGMGQVFRARDTKLDRDVAIKVLPETFAQDGDRLARFTREARTLASLNHPHVAAIYGLEESGGVTALVMELVEGEDLAQRIARGAIPLDEALAIARQIAEALEAAHEQGIVHRDLKPANIKVRADGTVKVLDFGLAKAMVPAAGSAPDLAMPPTITTPAMTQAGMILGTAAYMAPEQAKGRAVDRRADIWSFGLVLYEMLTGRRAFTGEDVGEVLASVLRDTPDMSALPNATPPSIRRLLRRSLEKDPKRRLSAIGDARIELDEAHSEPPAALSPSPGRRRSAVIPAAVVLALTGLAATAAWLLKPAAALPLRMLELPGAMAASNQVVLSPDGTRVAYILDGHLQVRALNAVLSQDLGPVSRSEESGSPPASLFPSTLFWSPDSTTLGFTVDREIRTVPAGGGPMFTVTGIPATGEAIAARWFHDGTIVFAVWRESVYSVPATGGTPAVALALNVATEIDVHHLSEGPDGSLIALIHQRSGDRGVTVLAPRGTSASATRVLVSDDQTINRIDYVAPGLVIFERQKTNAGLWVAPFTGGPLDVTRASLLQAGATGADAASDGSAIFVLPAASRATPVWVDRTGRLSDTIGSPVSWYGAGFALAPDGRRVAIVRGGGSAETLGDDDMSLIVRDLVTGTDTRLTVPATDGRSAGAPVLINAPSWFPAGDRILLSSGETEAGHLVTQRSDEATQPRDFAAGLLQGRLSRDGRVLAALRDERGRIHLMSAPVSADGVVGEARRVHPDDDALVDAFDLSPDGRLVAYSVRLGPGSHSVFLSEFPTSRNQWQVADDASSPRFSPDGREIFYVGGTGAPGQPERRLMSRAVSTTPNIVLGPATALFGGDVAATLDAQGYGVAPDGRFLTMKSVAPAPGEGKRLIWMQNWPAAMKK